MQRVNLGKNGDGDIQKTFFRVSLTFPVGRSRRSRSISTNLNRRFAAPSNDDSIRRLQIYGTRLGAIAGEDRITVNRTTIAIAHRLPTLRNADCIYVMEQSQLVEGGSHEELLERVEPYASLW
jgi:hypothetical protein